MKILFVLLLTSNIAFSQTSTLDSLKNALSTQQEDTNKVNTLNDLAWELRKFNHKKAQKYAVQAQKLSIDLNYEFGYIKSLERQGNVALARKDYQSAKGHFLAVLDLYTKKGSTYDMARMHSQLGVIHKKLDENDEAIRYYHLALDGMIALDTLADQASILDNLFRVHKKKSELDLALKYLTQSVEIRENLKLTTKLAKSYSSLGSYYNEIGDYDRALSYYLKSGTIHKEENNRRLLAIVYDNIGVNYSAMYQFDQALLNYSKSVSLKKELGIENDDATVYINIGSLYFRKQDYQKAYDYYIRAKLIQEASPNGNVDEYIYYNLGCISSNREKFLTAISFFEKGLAAAVKAQNKISQIEINDKIAECYSVLGNYKKAFEYNERSKTLKSLVDKDYKNAVNSEANYKEEKNKAESLKKDKKILASEKKIVQEKAKLQQTTIYSLVIGALLLLLIIFIFYKNRQHKLAASIAEKNTQIEQQKTHELLKEMELKSLNSMLEGQEEERQRIAADLHDRLGSMLSMVKLHFQSMDSQIDVIKQENKTQYEMASELLDNACSEVRKIAHNMVSGVLDKFGLVPALEDLAVSLNQSETMSVEFISFGMDARLNRKLEVTIYRVVQELISNTLKHAEATDITIQLLQSKDNLNLIVEDNGIGFNADEKTNNGIGLKNLTSRVHHINGKLTIDSSPKTGTTVTIDIPNPIINPND